MSIFHSSVALYNTFPSLFHFDYSHSSLAFFPFSCCIRVRVFTNGNKIFFSTLVLDPEFMSPIEVRQYSSFRPRVMLPIEVISSLLRYCKLFVLTVLFLLPLTSLSTYLLTCRHHQHPPRPIARQLVVQSRLLPPPCPNIDCFFHSSSCIAVSYDLIASLLLSTAQSFSCICVLYLVFCFSECIICFSACQLLFSVATRGKTCRWCCREVYKCLFVV